MTEYVYKRAQCFIEAMCHVYPISTAMCFDDPDTNRYIKVLVNEESAKVESRWRWLAENKDELYFGYMKSNLDHNIHILRVCDKDTMELVYVYSSTTWRKLKNKLKRYGIQINSSKTVCFI